MYSIHAIQLSGRFENKFQINYSGGENLKREREREKMVSSPLTEVNHLDFFFQCNFTIDIPA